ncbi:hypothetical protein K2173_018262 [Erythroxylum novogranatense]|uniref:Uncharacterized protein n=1 Tax=Erythroxylum novogranatense TaxID=1862640 RepID=A0AAV8UDV7_9ROSI|nr:hypothetical protein K2173_018262 [Erythroxylum novogranatense]
MGCFYACFGSSKDRRRLRRPLKVQHRDQRNSGEVTVESKVSLVHHHSDKPIGTVSQVRGKPEDQLTLSPRKKVTFDLNVKAYEHVFLQESVEYLPDKGDGGKAFGKEDTSSAKASQSGTEDSSITILGSYPLNHRYQNSRDSDDELDYEESDVDDDGYYDDVYEDDSVMESKPQIPVNGVFSEENENDGSAAINGLPEREVKFNRNVRDRSAYVHSVLNPVENLTQWKAVKAKETPALRHLKENRPQVSFSSDPSFKALALSFKSEKGSQEIPVDASLSNWLGSPERTPINKPSTTGTFTITPEESMPSPKSFEDRPILGALTVEELKQFSASSSPRRSPPSCSPDEMPIIGTVGTYWNKDSSIKGPGSASSYKGIPNTTSKYREDKKVNWHSTPFETRLERSLNGDTHC